MATYKDIDDLFDDIKDDIKEDIKDIRDKISDGVQADLIAEWKEYILLLKRMNKNDLMELMRKYGISSLDEMDIVKVKTEFGYMIGLKNGSNRLRDARILEYILGKRTPLRNVLTKLSSKNTIDEYLK